jgi:hypothetical protein
MALEKQNIDVTFQGLETKQGEKLVQPGQLLELENAIFDTTGQLKKRNGYTKLGTDAYATYKEGGTLGDITAGVAIYSDGTKLFLAGKHNLFHQLIHSLSMIHKLANGLQQVGRLKISM